MIHKLVYPFIGFFLSGIFKVPFHYFFCSLLKASFWREFGYKFPDFMVIKNHAV